jgi:hypothetical protein
MTKPALTFIQLFPQFNWNPPRRKIKSAVVSISSAIHLQIANPPNPAGTEHKTPHVFLTKSKE